MEGIGKEKEQEVTKGKWEAEKGLEKTSMFEDFEHANNITEMKSMNELSTLPYWQIEFLFLKFLLLQT